MKNAKPFKDFTEFKNSQMNRINEMQQEIEELKRNITDSESKYKRLIADNKDGEADKIYHQIEQFKADLRAIQNREQTKREMYKSVHREKVLTLLAHQKSVKKHYADNRKKLLDDLRKPVEEYNAIIEQINALNDEYRDELNAYEDVYVSEGFQQQIYDGNRDLRNDLNNVGFNAQASSRQSVIGLASDLPYISDKDGNKLIFK